MQELAAAMLSFARVTAGRAPFYSRLASGLAEQPVVLDILARAPRRHRIPATLFAALHSLVLAEPCCELAEWFPNLRSSPRTDDPTPAVVDFCLAHRGELIDLVARRPPQTNEIGRSALLLAGLAKVSQEVGNLAMLDVGASAGLNLLLDRYGYRYSGVCLGDQGQVVLECELRGESRPDLVPRQLPVIAARVGLDKEPIDLGDPEAVRRLEACVWPDQTDRFERLAAAVDLARRAKPPVVEGDAVADLAAVADRLSGAGHLVVTTSWVLTYLEPQHRVEFLHELHRLAASRDLTWVYAEPPSYTPELPWSSRVAGSELTVLGMISWRDRELQVTELASCHPHGYWLEWLG